MTSIERAGSIRRIAWRIAMGRLSAGVRFTICESTNWFRRLSVRTTRYRLAAGTGTVDKIGEHAVSADISLGNSRQCPAKQHLKLLEATLERWKNVWLNKSYISSMFGRVYYFLRIARRKSHSGTLNWMFLLFYCLYLIILDNACKTPLQYKH